VTAMIKTKKKPQGRGAKGSGRLAGIQKKIAPFIKRRRFKTISTQGRWVEASSVCGRVDQPAEG